MTNFFKSYFQKKEKLLSVVLPALILLIMFFIAFFSSKGAFGDPGDSAIVDEIAHIPAGYTYIKDLDYRLNPEHPPIAKALAGASMVLAGIQGPESDWSWNDIYHLNGAQWNAGWYMLYHTSNNPKDVLIWARFPMMLLMIGLGILLYKWASKVYGWKIGLLVLTFFAFYPDVLAHGRLVTTDIAAALGYVLTIFFFDKAMTERTLKTIIIAGIAFGLAQLLKFSAFLLFPILFFLIIIKAVLDRKENGGFLKTFWSNFKSYFWICLISLIFVWIIYIPFVLHTPSGVEHKLIEANLTSNPATLPLRNFLHLFENNPITRALGHYFLGIMMVISRVEGGNNTFILGHLSGKSISWFFPVAWLLKTAIPVILLTFASIFYIIFKFPKDKKEKWLLSLILMPIAVYWAFTLKGQLDIGIRHLMPTVPFVLLLIGYLSWKIFTVKKGFTIPKITVLILIGYMIVSTLSNYPNFISYFNEATPKDQRYKRLVDSSLDWGQDLLRLKKYVDDNNIKDIKVDYFGGSVPSYYIPQSKQWHAEYGPTTGWLAVSATFYQSSKLVGRQEGKWSYDWLENRKPDAIIGGSILVFNITQEEISKNPPVSPYPITKIVTPTSENINAIGL